MGPSQTWVAVLATRGSTSTGGGLSRRGEANARRAMLEPEPGGALCPAALRLYIYSLVWEDEEKFFKKLWYFLEDLLCSKVP